MNRDLECESVLRPYTSHHVTAGIPCLGYDIPCPYLGLSLIGHHAPPGLGVFFFFFFLLISLGRAISPPLRL